MRTFPIFRIKRDSNNFSLVPNYFFQEGPQCFRRLYSSPMVVRISSHLPVTKLKKKKERTIHQEKAADVSPLFTLPPPLPVKKTPPKPGNGPRFWEINRPKGLSNSKHLP